MKMSELKRLQVYAAISEPIMRKRIKIQLEDTDPVFPSTLYVDDVDEMLFKLEQEIWKELKEALKLEGP